MLNNRILNSANNHFEDNFWLYIISLFCFFLGIILGVYTVKYLGPVEKNHLVSYLTGFSSSMKKNKINNKDIFFQSIKNNVPLVAAIWFLGLTMVGTPVILIIDIIKGYTIGFTISFVIKGLGIKGIWVSLLGVIPQNIIYIPCLLVASVSAIDFSINFFKNNMYKHWNSNLLARIAAYSVVFIFIIIIMSLGFLFEAYATPFFINLLL